MAVPPRSESMLHIDEALKESVADFLISGEMGKQFHDHVRVLAGPLADGGAAVPAAPGCKRQAPLEVNAMELFDALPHLYPLVSRWAYLKEILNVAARRASMKAVGYSGDTRVRLVHVPGAAFSKTSVSHLRVVDVGCFVRFVGTVTRAGAVKVVQEMRDFQCEQCGNKFRCRASPEAGYEFDVPKECRSGENHSSWDAKAKRPKTSQCYSKSFLSLPCGEDCMDDFQEVRVQDQMHAVTAGVVPGSIGVVLFGALIGRIQPGDSVSVEGVVHQRWKAPLQGKRLDIEMFIEATNLERIDSNPPVSAARVDQAGNAEFQRFWSQHRDDEWKARTQIVNAVAPWLSGVPVPKLALLLTLIGGVPADSSAPSQSNKDAKWRKYLANDPAEEKQTTPLTDVSVKIDAAAAADKVHTRTTPHLLLLGDPGTGKSQLLQAASELAGRCVRTTGLGCSGAGLTCAAVRDGADFVLEAGALVLADGGVCCIDEFSTIRSNDRAAVHEAMEQQTVSVAKAGLVCRLRSQCSVVAAQNCKRGSAHGRGASYDCNSSVAVNSGLPPPLLSRFDLVVVFAEDSKGKASEQDKAEFILEASTAPCRMEPTNSKSTLGDDFANAGSAKMAWTHEKLREYIALVRSTSFTEPVDYRADQALSAYFCVLRRSASQGVGSGGVTVRTLQSLLRLAQAHGRLMHHSRVELEDAVAAIVLHRAALQDRVVGADMSGDGEDCAPTMRDREDERPACDIKMRICNLELHHGSDIADQSTYDFMEKHILKGLQLRKCPDGSLVEDKDLLVLTNFPTPQQRPIPIVDAGWSQNDLPSPGGCESSQGATQARGRNLGCRLR